MRFKRTILTLALALAGASWGLAQTITTVAGSWIPEGVPAASVSVGEVSAVAVDGAGNVYLASMDFSVVLRRESTGILTRVAGRTGVLGYGGDNGPANLAQLRTPTSIAIDSSGALYIADANNHRIRKVSDGVITTVAGNGTMGYSGDNGPATDAQLNWPSGVAVDTAGNLYISDKYNHRVRKVSNGVITTVAGNGTGGLGGDNVPATSAQLYQPAGVAVDSSGNLYIADGYPRIRKVSNGTITTFAGSASTGYGGDNGPATAARLSGPAGVAVDPAGNVYIADQGNHRIRRVANGVITTVAGNGTEGYGGDNGPAVSAQLRRPSGVTLDRAGNLYVAEANNYCIRRVSNGVITTVAGNGFWSYSGDDGPAVRSQLALLAHVALGPTGEVYIADVGNNRVRKVSNGVITTVAGTGKGGYSGDNGPALSAQLNMPTGVAVDSAGNLYITDYFNKRVRKVSNGVITTIAGNGTFGSSGDNGPATSAELQYLAGVAVDSSGNVYFSDGSRIRRISNGIITTVAGNGSDGYGGDDGIATNAQLHYPFGIAIDSAGTLYIADSENHRVRKVANGIITTVAGNGTDGDSADGAPATGVPLRGPEGIAVDASGNLYFADGDRVRKVSNGIITTVAGDGTRGYDGDDGPAFSAQLCGPEGIAFDSTGNLYVVDRCNHRIRKVSSGRVAPLATVSAASFTPAVPLTPGVIAAGYGTNLVSTVEVAPATGPLPTSLAQTSVKVRDSAGVERTAPLWFVSPSQINYYIPEETALGLATITVMRNAQTIASGTLQIDRVAPGLFTMNADGQGVPAAVAIFTGGRPWQYVFNLGCLPGSCQPVSIDLGPATDQVFLQLYGTGIRGRSSLAAVTAKIGGVDAPVEYAGPVSGLVGLDQVNLLVPRSLAGRGEVDVSLTVDGKTANTVRVNIK